MRDCKEIRAQFPHDVLGDLDDEARAAVKAHLAVCESCRRQYRLDAGLVSEVQAALNAVPIPEPFKPDVWWQMPLPEARGVSDEAVKAEHEGVLNDVAWALNFAKGPEPFSGAEIEAMISRSQAAAQALGFPRLRRLRNRWMAAAAMLLAGLSFWAAREGRMRGGGVDGAAPAVPGALVSVRGPEEEAALELPPAVPGNVSLKSGEACLRLASGVELALVGPADMYVSDAMQVILLKGRLLAHVPPHAAGFTVRTAELEMWDLGTVFGVSVSNSVSDVFVFQGSVQINASNGDPVDLCEAGEGVRAVHDQTPYKVEADGPEARALFEQVAGRRKALRAPAETFAVSDRLAALWDERWLPRIVSRQKPITQGDSGIAGRDTRTVIGRRHAAGEKTERLTRTDGGPSALIQEKRDEMKKTTRMAAYATAAVTGLGIGSAAAAPLLYEAFETGAGKYTADAHLVGQPYLGFGEATGTWYVTDLRNTNAATVRAIGLRHVVASKGGRVAYNAQTGGGVILAPDMSAQGPFATAGLYDTVSGKIGGGAVSGVMYVSFLFRAATTPASYNWCALQTYRDDVEQQALGGMPSQTTTGYGIFGTSTAKYLRNRGGTGDPLTPDTATRLFVAKITFHAGAADDLTVWMDPDPAQGDVQDDSVYMYAGTAVGDLSFDEFRIRGGSSKTWEYDEIRVGTDWATVTPPETQPLAYDGFLTGAGGYAADAFLAGQAMLGSGHAAGNWSGSTSTNSYVQAAGLNYKGIYRDGGKVMQRGLGNKGDSAKLDTAAEGPANLAGLVHTDGVTLGGGNVSGPLFVSFLLRFHNPGNVEPGRWGGLGIYRGNIEVQALGGKHYGAHGYSLFSGEGGTGNVDLRNATSYVTVDTSVRLFVAKITFNPGTNDHLTVWLDPDPAKGESQSATVATYSTNYVCNLAFDNYALRAGSSGAVAAIDFDEVRFGRTWQSVLPPPKPGTFIAVR